MDDDMLRQIDEVAASKGASRSWVMREAIRTGLPMVSSGGLVEVVPVDPELQRDVTNVTAWKGLTRGKLLLEALKIGLPAVNARLPNADEKPLPDQDFFQVFSANDPYSVPVARDFRRAEYKAAYLRDVMEQVCLLTEVEGSMERERQEAKGERTPVSQQRSVRDQIQRADRVHRWARKNGKLMGVSLDMASRFPYETFCRYEAEMLAEEAASGITPEPAPKLQGSAGAVPAVSPSPAPSPKPKPTRKPRKG